MKDIRKNTQKGTKYTSGRQLAIGAAIFVLIFAIGVYLPSYITYRDKNFCTKAESDAKAIAAHLADYLSDHNVKTIPNVEQLIDQGNITLSGDSTATVTITDPNGPIEITVTDSSGRCPVAYQDATTGWDGNGVFTEIVEAN